VKSLFFLLALTVVGQAIPADPGKAALSFLEKVRERKINLEPGGDTALTAQTEPAKKEQIAKRLQRIAGDLGKWPLEVGAVQMDENFAAVLVRKTGGYDPSRMQVFSVAMVKRGADWLAAPVPSSFENAGAGYAIALRKRLKRLEDWMLREQVAELAKLREQSTSELRQKIEVSLAAKDLRSYDANQVVARFLTACDKQDLAAVLGFLGGLGTTLPADWAARLKAADQVLAPGANAGQPWRRLIAPEVVRLTVPEELSRKSAVFNIVCLDPAGNDRKTPQAPSFEGVRLELVKTSDGLWQINLPGNFLNSLGETVAANEEAVIPDTFMEKWGTAYPPVPQASAVIARQAFIAALGESDMRALLGLVKLPAEPVAAVKTCLEVARIWWLFHAPGVVSQAMPLETKAGETTAAVMFQLFDAREADRFQPQMYYFEKTATGWLWNPSPGSALCEEFRPWEQAESTQWAAKWQATFFVESVLLAKIPNTPLVAEYEARKCVQAWLTAIHQTDLPAALRHTARLEDAASGSLTLRNLGYELASSRQNDSPPEITGIYQGKFWTLVGAKTQRSGKTTYPLYPVVQTPDGARLLAEVDLFAAGNRGREFLNRAAIQRLADYTSAEAITELSELYSRFQEATSNRTNH
jgi:hypothetical protein